jgi:hypothetical protein
MRTTGKLAALTAVAAMAVGAGTAQARHGADDPAGHHKGRGADDTQPHFKHGADDNKAGHRHRHHRHHGADDGPNHR